MKWRYLIALSLLVVSAVMISLVMKSCEMSESEKIQKEIKTNETDIQAIQAKRDSANAVVITDSNRAETVESANRKNGLDLFVRKSKGN